MTKVCKQLCDRQGDLPCRITHVERAFLKDGLKRKEIHSLCTFLSLCKQFSQLKFNEGQQDVDEPGFDWKNQERNKRVYYKFNTIASIPQNLYKTPPAYCYTAVLPQPAKPKEQWVNNYKMCSHNKFSLTEILFTDEAEKYGCLIT